MVQATTMNSGAKLLSAVSTTLDAAARIGKPSSGASAFVIAPKQSVPPSAPVAPVYQQTMPTFNMLEGNPPLLQSFVAALNIAPSVSKANHNPFQERLNNRTTDEKRRNGSSLSSASLFTITSNVFDEDPFQRHFNVLS